MDINDLDLINFIIIKTIRGDSICRRFLCLVVQIERLRLDLNLYIHKMDLVYSIAVPLQIMLFVIKTFNLITFVYY